MSFIASARSIAVLLALPVHALAASWVPDGAYLQYGRTVGDTHAVTAGAIWEWPSRIPLWVGEVGGYWDLAIGHWRTRNTGSTEWAVVTQVGVTPTFRWRPQGAASPWFVEGAVGFTAMSPLYEGRGKRFSTTFNFADHVGLGWNFGAQHRHEIVLRYEHFSNGGIRRPNPGENFWQLRYVLRWP